MWVVEAIKTISLSSASPVQERNLHFLSYTNTFISFIIVTGPGSVGRSRFLFLQQYILATIYPFVASLYIHTLKPPEEQDDGFLQNGKEKWFTLLAPNLQSLLAKNGGGTFLMGGDSPTALDFLLAKPLGNARSMNALDDFPELLALLEQVEKRPSYAHAYGIAPPPAPCKTSPVQTRSLLFVSSGED